jgi:hypothetical protein
MRDSEVFDYVFAGAGSATATIRLDGVEHVIFVSDIHDSPRELAGALIALDTSPREIAVYFVELPGSVRLVMRRPDDEHVQIELLRLRDWPVGRSNRRDNEPERLGSATLRWRTFRGAVLSVLQRLWRAHGPEGYATLWRHSFPVDELRALKVRRA